MLPAAGMPTRVSSAILNLEEMTWYRHSYAFVHDRSSTTGTFGGAHRSARSPAGNPRLFSGPQPDSASAGRAFQSLARAEASHVYPSPALRQLLSAMQEHGCNETGLDLQVRHPRNQSVARRRCNCEVCSRNGAYHLRIVVALV